MAPRPPVVIEPGARLEHYELLSLLGRGGMGEVWLARDLRLERRVAIKLLSPDLTQDSAHVDRFRQEARAASALSHPNICAVHVLGTADDGRLFIAMEYVEGATLRQRLADGRLSVPQALDIGIQIASALSAAHAAGLIHRDVKPENVMIRPDGLVKVVDFGLAKLIAMKPAVEILDPTRTAVHTITNTIVGTVSYMSPEQARGERLDSRTDLFSLGAVLYEMVAGRQAFSGSSQAIIFDGILNRMPTPAPRVNSEVPAKLDDIITKAIEKNRELRYQSASELQIDLKRVQRETDSGPQADPIVESGVPKRHVGWQRPLAAAVALTTTLSLIGIGWYVWRSLARQPELQEQQLTTNSSEAPVVAAAISPDGKYLAYADVTGLYMRLLQTRETHPLPGLASGVINRLAWFPDSSRLLVSGLSSGTGDVPGIWTVSLFGGAPRKLRDDGIDASVSRDGSQIVFVTSQRREIWGMGPDGSDPRRIFLSAEGDTLYSPGLFTDGRIGYGRVHPIPDKSGAIKTQVTIESRNLQSGQSFTVLSDPKLTGGAPMPDGRLIYSLVADPIFTRSPSLWEANTDALTGRITGSPRRIGSWEGSGLLTSFSVTADGRRLTYLRAVPQGDVYVGELDVDGALNNPRRLTLDDSNDFPTNWTPDSRAVLFHSDRNGTFDIFKQGLDQRTAETVVATNEDEMGPPAISPDGRWLLYEIQPKGWRLTLSRPRQLMRVPAAGGPPEKVIDKPGEYWPSCARPPSTTCVVSELTSKPLVFYMLDPARGPGRELTRTNVGSAPFYSFDLSPDGSHIAVLMPAEGQIKVLSLSGKPERDIAVPARSLTAGIFSWSSDGGGWYVSSTSAAGTDLLFVDVGGHTRVLRHQQTAPQQTYAIPSPDGKHLAFTETTSISNVWMIENF